MSESTKKLRWRFQGRAVLLLAAVWVLLWGEFSLLNILYGLVLGWLITVVFWLPPIRYYGQVRLGWVVVLVLAQLRDLAVASFQLALASVSPRIDLRPGIIKVRLHTNSDLFQVAVAVLISIVPGTLVVDTVRRPRLLYLHVFHLPDARAVKHQRAHALAIEARLIRAFGTDHDLRGLEHRMATKEGG